MAKVKVGDRVKLHYTGRLSDGSVFDSSQDAGDEVYRNFKGGGVAFAPMELVVGKGEMLPAFEEALVGLEPGARLTITLPPARAFGSRHEDRVMTIARDEIVPREAGIESFRVAEGRHRPNNFDPGVGDVLEVTTLDGSLAPAKVIAMTDDSVTLDWNHPLAGRELTFEIRLVEIA
ncbi:MAG: FKBP-type peptidyl-prolyl cis-trans isomerase [Anaeromyxobacter sp.]